MRVGVDLRHFLFVCAWVCEEREGVNVFESVHLCVNGGACLCGCVRACVCGSLSVHQHLAQEGGWAVKPQRWTGRCS